MTYDIRGRKKTLNDPDAGSIVYSYNSAGDLTSESVVNGRTVGTSYDALGRPLSRSATVPGKTSFTTSYSYDGYNAKGKLTQERNITPAGTQIRSWSFDTLSRLSSSKVDIAATNLPARAFETYTTYDSYSRVEKIVYPQNGSATNFLKYVYENGYFKSAMYNATTVWNTTARTSDQQVKTATLGGGLTINRTYDNLGRIASINTVTAAAPVTTLQNASFAFDALGNLTARTDNAAGAGVNDTFCYDKLNRLVGTGSAAACTQSTFYDAYGNLTAKPGMASYGYGTIGTNNRLTSANGVTLAYDASGNITGDGTRTFSYTPYDIPDKITQGALWSEWGFTGNGQRAFERRGSGTTATGITYQAGPGFFEQDETISGTTSTIAEVREFLTTPAGTIGVVITRNGVATTNYYLQDHLGSNVASVTSAGVIVARSKFDPWGLRTVTAGIVDNGDRGFTGHEHLDFGLIHMNGRIYDPKWGRFLQADPIIQSPYDLQNYNRYSYVMNNPVSMTDPSGYSARSFNRFMTRFTALHGDFAHSYIDRRWGMRAYNDPYVRTVAGAVAGYFTYGAVSGWAAGLGSVGAGAAGGAAAGFAAGGIQGGNLNSALHGAITGALSGALISGLGEAAVGEGPSDFYWNSVAGADGAAMPIVRLETIKVTPSYADRFFDFLERNEALIEGVSLSIRMAQSGNGPLKAPSVRPPNKPLPDSALVCRGGTCKADNFANGSGVTRAPDGTLNGVSTQSKPGASVGELAKPYQNNQIGLTTAGDIRAAGGQIKADGWAGNPNHATVSGLSAQELEKLFKVTTNPVPKINRGLGN
jgi:RHS repeat-associated protein